VTTSANIQKNSWKKADLVLE